MAELGVVSESAAAKAHRIIRRALCEGRTHRLAAGVDRPEAHTWRQAPLRYRATPFAVGDWVQWMADPDAMLWVGRVQAVRPGLEGADHVVRHYRRARRGDFLVGDDVPMVLQSAQYREWARLLRRSVVYFPCTGCAMGTGGQLCEAEVYADALRAVRVWEEPEPPPAVPGTTRQILPLPYVVDLEMDAVRVQRQRDLRDARQAAPEVPASSDVAGRAVTGIRWAGTDAEVATVRDTLQHWAAGAGARIYSDGS
ncbi:hypothetical protein HK101_007106, partial [Irineochytrium annulatum]